MTISSAAEMFMRGRYLIDQETPNDMIARVAGCVVPNESPEYRERITNQMQAGFWLPSSPFLMNAGGPHPMLSSCFVVGVHDNIDDIFDAIKNMAKIQKWGGGTGMSFSQLREAGAPVGGTKGIASGPVSFMRVFDAATDVIKQGGKRRGANIAVLADDHPDIMEFVHSKSDDLEEMMNFNISVMASDAFMNAVQSGREWVLWSRSHGEKELQCKVIDASRLWYEIVDSAWRTGDPGLVFTDAVERGNPTPHLGPMDGVNPCGEISLYENEACNLASINLTKMLTPDRQINWLLLNRVVRDMVTFMDDALDVSQYPIEAVTKQVRMTRKIGIGITGLHEMLIARGLPYESKEAVKEAAEIMSSITAWARQASIELAESRGAFPAWKENPIVPVPRRNATLTCIAPTGTISMIMGVQSSGCEPLFSLTYKREVLGASYMFDVPQVVIDAIERMEPLKSSEILDEIRKTGSAQDCSCCKELKDLLKTAQEISIDGHIQMQAALQKCTENNISKTVNLPRYATRDDVSRAYMLAWELGCHGITVFRDGCRGEQVMTHMRSEKDTCPVCGGLVVQEENCRHCTSCGWSVCSS